MRRTKQIIDAREFQEWQEYYKQEPFGDDWDQAAVVASTSVNIWAKRKVDPKRFKPNFGTNRRKSAEQMEAELMHFARLHNKAYDNKAKKEKKPKGK